MTPPLLEPGETRESLLKDLFESREFKVFQALLKEHVDTLLISAIKTSYETPSDLIRLNRLQERIEVLEGLSERPQEVLHLAEVPEMSPLRLGAGQGLSHGRVHGGRTRY